MEGLSGGGGSRSGEHETVVDGDLGPRRRSVDGIGQTAVNLEALANWDGTHKSSKPRGRRKKVGIYCTALPLSTTTTVGETTVTTLHVDGNWLDPVVSLDRPRCFRAPGRRVAVSIGFKGHRHRRRRS